MNKPHNPASATSAALLRAQAFMTPSPVPSISTELLVTADGELNRELHDFLLFGFVTHFRPAKNDDHFRSNALDGCHDFRGWRHVPDVDAEADDPGILRQQRFGNVHGSLIDVELHQLCARTERAEIGHEVTQSERGVNVFRVERGEENVQDRKSVV